MKRTELERSSNQDPGSRCLPEPRGKARVGVAKRGVSGRWPVAQLEAKEAEADQGN
jgi:hypothetical protein